MESDESGASGDEKVLRHVVFVFRFVESCWGFWSVAIFRKLSYRRCEKFFCEDFLLCRITR